MTTFDGIPQDLKERPQWVNWRGEPDPKRPGKLIKRPVSAHNGVVVDAHNPNNWATFQEAVQRVTMPNSDVDGVGYVLTEGDPYVGVDLDNCVEDGVIAEWAQKIVERLNSYTEITPSGKGLRIFVRGTLPPHGRKRGNVEMYSDKRFLTVTGAHI